MKSGADLWYGFSIENGELVKKTLHNLPLFCLALDGQQCDELLTNIDYQTGNTSLNDVEERYLSLLLDSIRDQQSALLNNDNVNDPEIRANLMKVEQLLA